MKSRGRYNAKSIMMVTFLCLGLSWHAEAKMAYVPQKSIACDDLISSLEQLQNKSKELSAAESELLLLARFGKLALNIKEFIVVDRKVVVRPEQEVSRYLIVGEMHKQIHQKSLWTGKFDPALLNMVSSDQVRLKNGLSTDSYVLTWFEFQMGNTEIARKAMQTAFEKDFQEVMQSKENGYSRLRFAQENADALKKMLSANEFSQVSRKLEKMKLHVSKQPNSQIMT